MVVPLFLSPVTACGRLGTLFMKRLAALDKLSINFSRSLYLMIAIRDCFDRCESY